MSTEQSRRLDEALARNLAHELRLEEARPGNRAALFDALAAAGVVLVTLPFDGYGDEGQVGEAMAFDAAGAGVPLPGGTVPIRQPEWGEAEVPTGQVSVQDALEHTAYDLLGEHQAGWENGEGSYGEFAFDVAARAVTLECRVRYVASDLYVHEL